MLSKIISSHQLCISTTTYIHDLLSINKSHLHINIKISSLSKVKSLLLLVDMLIYVSFINKINCLPMFCPWLTIVLKELSPSLDY